MGDGLWSVGGTILMWGAALLFIVAMFHDWMAQRVKHRRRCPRCWYDMSHSPPGRLTCSECGYTAKRERSLYRARRRWKLVWLSLFIAVAGHGLHLTTAVKQRGWVAAVPTTIAIAMVPWLEPPPFDVYISPRRRAPSNFRQELCSDLIDYRLRNGQLMGWQQSTLMNWSIAHTSWHGEFGDEPDAAGWVIRQAIDARNIDALNSITDEQLAKLFDQSMPELVLMRAEWPKDVPARVAFRPSWYFAIPEAIEVTATPRFTSATCARRLFTNPFALGEPSSTWQESAHEIGTPPSETREIILDVVVSTRRGWNSDATKNELWSGTVIKQIQLADGADAILRAVNDDDIGAKLRGSLDVFDADYIDQPRILVSFRGAFDNAIEGVALGLSIQIVHDDEMVMQGTMWAGREWQSSLRQFLALEGDVKRVSTADLSDGLWRVVVRGDPIVALRDFNATSYWAGEFETPLVLRRPEQ